jgi:hypothetical protein
LTASNIDAATNAVTRVVAKGLVCPAITVSFIIPIHCRTGSGAAAKAGTGFTVIHPATGVIRIKILAAENRQFLTDMVISPSIEFRYPDS